MKIGILTFHCVANYGAVFQAYALQQTLIEYGHDVEIINYTPNYFTDQHQSFSIKLFKGKNIIASMKLLTSMMLTQSKINMRKKQFSNFLNTKLFISKSLENEIPGDYDLYILGSDQIWNKKITKGFDKVFFGNFPIKKKSKIITYAASIGNAEFTLDDLKEIKNLITDIDGISVREDNLKSILVKLTKKPIQTVVDPTLLLNRNKWDEIIIESKIKKRYVLVYRVQMDKSIIRIAHEIAKQINCIVVEIPAWVTLKNLTNKQLLTSPEEYLGWFKRAECIISGSFHGTAFSIIFNRPFYAINLNDGTEKRSKHLLESLGLSNRLIDKKSIVEFTEIDYQVVNKKLSELKMDSLTFLNKYL